MHFFVPDWHNFCNKDGLSDPNFLEFEEFGDEHSFIVASETLPETIESGPLGITDLFQNKFVAYF